MVKKSDIERYKKQLIKIEDGARLEQKIESLKKFSQSLGNYLYDNDLADSQYAREFIDLYDSRRYSYEEEKVIEDAKSILDDLEEKAD
jgi:hypothetical protein